MSTDRLSDCFGTTIITDECLHDCELPTVQSLTSAAVATTAIKSDQSTAVGMERMVTDMPQGPNRLVVVWVL